MLKNTICNILCFWRILKCKKQADFASRLPKNGGRFVRALSDK
jgi:hypothetical protein